MVKGSHSIIQKGPYPFVIGIQKGDMAGAWSNMFEALISGRRRPRILLVNNLDRTILQEIADLLLGWKWRPVIDHQDLYVNSRGVVQNRTHALAQKSPLALEIRYDHCNLRRAHGQFDISTTGTEQLPFDI